MISSFMRSRRLASAGISPNHGGKMRGSRPPSGRLSPIQIYRARNRLFRFFHRKTPPGRGWRPAKACPIVRSARHDQAGEPRVDNRFGAQEVQAAEYGYTAQDREPEQPAFAVLQVRERVAQHGDRNQYLSGDEKLRLVRAERSQAEERADQGEFGKTDRAGGRSDESAEAADLFKMSFHIQVDDR